MYLREIFVQRYVYLYQKATMKLLKIFYEAMFFSIPAKYNKKREMSRDSSLRLNLYLNLIL